MALIRYEKLTPSDIIQILIFCGILITCILTGLNIRQQGEFNKNTLRPWVYDELKSFIKLKGEYIHCEYVTRCIGNTPAYNVNGYGMIDDRRFYSEDEILYAIQRWDVSDKTPDIMHPNETLYGTDSNTMIIEGSIKDTLINLIKNNQLYRHSYIEYGDISHNKYGLQRTWQFRYSRDSNYKFYGTWVMIFTSPHRIR